jgi:hypothetical protein
MAGELKRFDKLGPNDHKLLPFEQMGNKRGYLSKISGPTVQLPKMRVPWDCTSIEDQNGQMKAQISLSFDRENPAHSQLEQMLEELDDKAIAHIIANKSKIFEGGKKVPTDDMIRDQMYYRMVKPSSQPDKYGPTMKAKIEVRASTSAVLGPSSSDDNGGGIDIDGGEPDAKRARMSGGDEESPHVLSVGCFAKNESTGEYDEVSPMKALTKGCMVRLVVGLRHIWCINGRMGLTLYGHRLIVDEFPRTVKSFDFDLDDEEEGGDGAYGVALR